MKIIDADKLHYKQVYIQTEKGLRPALVVFAKEIRKMPEIVRCKDCKWYWKNSVMTNAPMCLASPKDDAFCSEGVRKDEID